MAAKEFEVWMAPRSYRYKEEALYSHAPQNPGIYSIVTFDEAGNGKYLYIGLTLDKSIFDCLSEHWRGDREPKVHDLLAKNPNVYFGFIEEANATSPEDWKDLYWAMVTKEKPTLVDVSSVTNTGRFEAVSYRDKSLLG